jgi:hypothetical protein
LTLALGAHTLINGLRGMRAGRVATRKCSVTLAGLNRLLNRFSAPRSLLSARHQDVHRLIGHQQSMLHRAIKPMERTVRKHSIECKINCTKQWPRTEQCTANKSKQIIRGQRTKSITQQYWQYLGMPAEGRPGDHCTNKDANKQG